MLHREEVRVPDPPGVVSQNDVRMNELGGRLHFAVEAVNRIRVGQPLLANDLQRDGAVHHAMMSLIDPAHRPLTEPVQKAVRADVQLLGTSLDQLIDLKSGQPAPLHQAASQRAKVGCTGFRPVAHFL